MFQATNLGGHHAEYFIAGDLPSAAQFFALADKDNNGFLDWHEFVGCLFNPARMSVEETTRLMKVCFEKLAGEDNVITIPVIEGLLDGKDEKVDKLFIENSFRDIDSN